MKALNAGTRGKEKIVPWISSTREVIVEALKLARVRARDIVYDLGAGDGRVVVIAAKEYGAHGVGVEIDERLCGVIEVVAKYYGVSDKVEVICDDFFRVDVSPATVVYMYLYRSINEETAVKLEKELRDGARIVTVDFPIPGWIPIALRRLTDRTGLTRTVFLYVKGASNPGCLIKRLGNLSSIYQTMGLI